MTSPLPGTWSRDILWEPGADPKYDPLRVVASALDGVGAGEAPGSDIWSRLKEDDGLFGNVYRGIFGASAGDTTVNVPRTATGEAVPSWVWFAAAVVAGALVWRAVK